MRRMIGQVQAHESAYFEGPQYFFRDPAFPLFEARDSGFSLFNARDSGFSLFETRDLRLYECAGGGMPKITLRITGVPEILGRDHGIEERY